VTVDLLDVDAILAAAERAGGREDPLLPGRRDFDVPGPWAAHARVLRARLLLRLQQEAGLSRWGAEAAAGRLVARALLEELGLAHDVEEIARILECSRSQLDRDAKVAKGIGPD
jgi:hypothetical protein